MCTRDCRMISKWNGQIGKTDRERGPESRVENAICVDDAGAIVYGLVICVSYIDTRATTIRMEWEMGNINFCLVK